MKKIKGQNRQRLRRQRRVRVRVKGTADRPRVSIFRSHRHIAAQIIDDTSSTTLLAVSDQELTASPQKGKKFSRRDKALWVGEKLAIQARAKHIRAVRFDRGPYRFHGLVAAVAEGARKGGLTF